MIGPIRARAWSSRGNRTRQQAERLSSLQLLSFTLMSRDLACSYCMSTGALNSKEVRFKYAPLALPVNTSSQIAQQAGAKPALTTRHQARLAAAAAAGQGAGLSGETGQLPPTAVPQEAPTRFLNAYIRVSSSIPPCSYHSSSILPSAAAAACCPWQLCPGSQCMSLAQRWQYW